MMLHNQKIITTIRININNNNHTNFPQYNILYIILNCDLDSPILIYIGSRQFIGGL